MHRRTVRSVAAGIALACLPVVLLGPRLTPAGGVGAASTVATRPAASPYPVAPPTAQPRTSRPAGRAIAANRLAWQHGIPRTPITSLPHTGRTVTLTFDDGPDPRWTPTVLALLHQYHARAVFCLIGEHVAARPDLVRRIAQAGQVLCDHTWTHDEQLPSRPLSVIRREIDRTAAAIRQTTGVSPVYYRAPGGAWGPSVIAVARAAGMAPLGWQVDPSDWARPGVAAIVARVLAGVRPGAVVLMHDGYGHREQSVAALRIILARLSALGYRFTVPHW